MLVIYQEWTCIWTCMTIKVMERLIAMTGKSLLHEVSIIGVMSPTRFLCATEQLRC
jgi:hypothetical protein